MDYFNIYKMVWEFHKKHLEGINNGIANWDEIVTDADELYNKYEKCKFIKDLLIAELNELERISKKEV